MPPKGPLLLAQHEVFRASGLKLLSGLKKVGKQEATWSTQSARSARERTPKAQAFLNKRDLGAFAAILTFKSSAKATALKKSLSLMVP